MIDHLLDILDVDWSPGFVRWRAVAVAAAMALVPAQTLNVVTTWEQHRLEPVVAWIQHLGDTPQPTAPAAPRHKKHAMHRQSPKTAARAE